MTHLISLLLHDVLAAGAGPSGFEGPAAARYKLSTAEFAGVVAALAEARPPVVTIASRQDLAGADGAVAITVDDGGASFALIADALEAQGWRGHCFMSTDMIGLRGFLTRSDLRDLDRRGHVIGSHSASHPVRLSACPPLRILREWQDSRAALEDVLGHEVHVASLPGGYYSTAVARAAADAGLEVLFTSEPRRRLWAVGGCRLAGRFAIRPGQRTAELTAAAAGRHWPFVRQWSAWTVKKAAKSILGPGYPLIGERLGQRL